MQLLRVRRATFAVWLILASLALEPALARTSAAQADSPTASAKTGSVVLQSAGSDGGQPLGSDAQTVGSGDLLAVGDDGEASLNNGSTLTVRIFHQSQAHILGSGSPDDPVYELEQGATYNTASADPDSGSPVIVSTPGASVASASGTFLVYYDPGVRATWVIVTNGTARVTASGGAIDIPAAFLTSTVDGAAPIDPRPASRAIVGAALPAVEDLTGGALADVDILAAQQPAAVDTAAQPDVASAPPGDASGGQAAGTAGLLPALSDLGGLVPFPSTATLRAGKTTVWYWPQRQGNLDTVKLDDTREIVAGDGVNVSDNGRADLLFKDFSVQIFRHAQLQMIPTLDPNGYGLGYDLMQGTTLNTVSANALQQLSSDRIGVRAGWAVVTAVYTAHPTAEQEVGETGGLVAATLGAQGTPSADAQFFMTYDGTKSWVVVTEGTVQVAPVSAASGSIPAGSPQAAPVVVSAGFQTVVEPAQPPQPPRPATRDQIGTQFPTFEELTGGELTDSQVLAGSAVTPLPAPQSAPQPTAPGNPSLPTLKGITVPKPAFSPKAVTMMVAGTHNDSFVVTLNAPAPAPGGVTIALISADASRVSVASSVAIPAGGTSATFRVTALAPTVDYAQQVDHPVAIKASGPTTNVTIPVSVGRQLLSFTAANPPRTTNTSGVVSVGLTTLGSEATPIGSVLNAPLTVAFSVTDPTRGGAVSSIVTLTPSQATIPAGGTVVTATANASASTGTYQINASATGADTASLPAVTISR